MADRYRLVCNGNLFRVDYFDATGTQVESTAHDGHKYQLFDVQHKLYSESGEFGNIPQAPFYSPILWAYAWLLGGEGPQSVEYLLSPTPWEDIAGGFEIIDRPNLGSGSTFVAEIIRSRATGLDLLYRIEFSPEQNWLPMRWQSFRLPKRELSTTVEVTDLVTVSLDEGLEIGIPLEVSVSSPQIAGIYALDEASLRVNHRVDPDMFSLSSAQADFIGNRIADKSSLAEAVATRDHWSELRILWALAATFALLIAGTVIWRLRRRSK